MKDALISDSQPTEAAFINAEMVSTWPQGQPATGRVWAQRYRQYSSAPYADPATAKHR